LDRTQFYLLVSRERVRSRLGYAAEMAAYDPTSGELRTTTPDSSTPGFGDVPYGEWMVRRPSSKCGAHNVPFALEHGQRLCKLTFERRTEKPDELYGLRSGRDISVNIDAEPPVHCPIRLETEANG